MVEMDLDADDMMGIMRTNLKKRTDGFETLDSIGEAEVWGQLKSLEHLAHIIDAQRESYTRLLVVNGIDPNITEVELKERWRNVKGLDGSLAGSETSESSEIKEPITVEL